MYTVLLSLKLRAFDRILGEYRSGNRIVVNIYEATGY
jgi:hypothetical protein